jgi:hypothetical protein
MVALSIPEAVARRDAAKSALDMADTTLQLAIDQAGIADRRVAVIAAGEEKATGDFVARLRSAAAIGVQPERATISADAVERSTAEAEARSAHAAVRLLRGEFDEATAALATAELDVRVATNAACNEHAHVILAGMEAAYQTLALGAAHLTFLGRASFTPLPQPEGPLPPGSLGVQPLGLNLNQRGQMLMRLTGDGSTRRSPQQEQEFVGMWQAWRALLVDDPTTPSPWDMRE